MSPSPNRKNPRSQAGQPPERPTAVVLGHRPEGTIAARTGHAAQLPARYAAAVTVIGRGTSTPASSRMARQRTRDTGPELALRRDLHRRGMRYRVGYPVPGNPRRSIDIAFVGIRLAVFVDGCFWHGCPTHGTWPATNPQWWRDKIEANRARDADTDRLLGEHGWVSLRLWEHEVATAADRVQVAHTRRRLELQR